MLSTCMRGSARSPALPPGCHCIFATLEHEASRHPTNVMSSHRAHKPKQQTITVLFFCTVHLLPQFRLCACVPAGRDPKPFPPPVKLCREMVDAMGGADSEAYRRFRSLTCEAYNILRKSAPLLLTLAHLMAGSSIPDIHAAPETALLKLQVTLCPSLHSPRSGLPCHAAWSNTLAGAASGLRRNSID